MKSSVMVCLIKSPESQMPRCSFFSGVKYLVNKVPVWTVLPSSFEWAEEGDAEGSQQFDVNPPPKKNVWKQTQVISQGFWWRWVTAPCKTTPTQPASFLCLARLNLPALHLIQLHLGWDCLSALRKCIVLLQEWCDRILWLLGKEGEHCGRRAPAVMCRFKIS